MIRSTLNTPMTPRPQVAPAARPPVGPGVDTACLSRPSAPAPLVAAGGGPDEVINGFNGLNGVIAGMSRLFGGLFQKAPVAPAPMPAPPPQPVYYPVPPQAPLPQPGYYPAPPQAPLPQPGYTPIPGAQPYYYQAPITQPYIATQPAYYPAPQGYVAPQPTPSAAFQGQLAQLHQLVTGSAIPPAASGAPVSNMPAVAPAPVGSGPLLRNGETGPAVRALQGRLKDLGFDPGVIDGVFGPDTEKALKAFQQKAGLDPDGQAGPLTWAKLGIQVEKPKPPVITGDGEQLKKLTPDELAALGASDKAAFFAALKPAALAAEKEFGVPWQVTLAQAALESGWGKHAIGGFNIFGIKGTGPAGTVSVGTSEYRNGQYVRENASFAKYHDFYEAVQLHGKLFHNGYYDKAVNQFAKDSDPVAFVHNIQGIYATDPAYSSKILSIMQANHLV